MTKTALMTFLLLTATAFSAIEKWTVQDYWRRLEIKMTDQVVTDLLGDPTSKEERTTGQTWHYQDGKHGTLIFRPMDDDLLLYKWIEPDWTTTTPATETRYLREKSRIEAAEKAAQIQLEREKAAAERAALRKKQKAERDAKRAAERARQTEALEQRRSERTVDAMQRSHAIPAARETADDVHTKKSQRLFFYIGGFAFACAVAITFIKNKTEGFGHR